MGLRDVISKAAQGRMLKAIQLGHEPEFFQETYTPKYSKVTRPVTPKTGAAIRCSCGWRSARAYEKKQGAVGAFVWHLEEVLADTKRNAS
ncbi:hypothetical protein [Kineococcus sp. SYSU DK001]|uniref:hypothetical protein n=1 Tax=Kineococcus sp. SYSU DK001 TaxID=3383122 RepID=UPI003D7DAD3A